MSTRIYVALSSFSIESPEPLKALKQSGFEFVINKTGKRLSKDEVIASLKGFHGVIAGLEPYGVDVLKALPDLKCISRCGVGVDNVDLAAAQAQGIAVLNTPQVVVQPVAELTLAMILDLLRKVTAHTELMRQRTWQKLTGFQLAGRVIGIIGLGRIGKRVAQLLSRLEARVIAYDMYPDTAWAKDNGVELVGIDDLLSRADLVTLHLAPNRDHPFCLGFEEIKKMKKGAMLVNVARGALLDEVALADAMRHGHLGGAALDVFAQEPYTGPLCDLPNVLLTPHVGTLTQESRAAMEFEAVENLLRFFSKGR